MLDLANNGFGTQELRVKFLRPLKAPTVILVTSTIREIAEDGRSFVVEAAIKDGAGKEYAQAEARWAVFPIRNKL